MREFYDKHIYENICFIIFLYSIFSKNIIEMFNTQIKRSLDHFIILINDIKYVIFFDFSFVNVNLNDTEHIYYVLK